MENDRELIVLAAKAGDVEHAIAYDAYPEDGFPSAYAKTGKCKFWNPLADDGDALRLANRLRMRIEHHVRHPFVAVFAGESIGHVKAEEQHGADADAATRRAIVRAAAEVAKNQMSHDEFVLLFPDRFEDAEVERARAAAGRAEP